MVSPGGWSKREDGEGVRRRPVFNKKSSDGYRSTIKGIAQKTLVYGQNTLMAELKMLKGTRIPTHNHPHEQTGYLLTGRTRLFIDDQVYNCSPGDSWCIPGNAKHGTYAIKDSVLIEIFSPVREDLHPDTEYSPFIQSWNRWTHQNCWVLTSVMTPFLLNMVIRLIQATIKSYIIEKSIHSLVPPHSFQSLHILKNISLWKAIMTIQLNAFSGWNLKPLELS